jgi:hydrogenase nickel incorporation protein HypA/HybF
MHELFLTREIADIVCRAANGQRVFRVSLEIGELCCASPEAIAFCFDAVVQGTVAEGARLDIRRTGGDDCKVTTLEVEEAA